MTKQTLWERYNKFAEDSIRRLEFLAVQSGYGSRRFEDYFEIVQRKKYGIEERARITEEDILAGSNLDLGSKLYSLGAKATSAKMFGQIPAKDHEGKSILIDDISEEAGIMRKILIERTNQKKPWKIFNLFE